jgi:Na+/melibiose symporter-like transporter
MTPTASRSIVLSLYTTLTYLVYMAVCGVIGLGSMLGSWRYSILILGILELCVFAWAMLFLRRSCTTHGKELA